MTVTYTKHVHTVTCGGFLHLLRLWKGSLMKAIWKDLLLYLILFSSITAFYRHYLLQHEDLKRPFEIMCVYCRRFSHLIPLSFLLGFYVSLVVTRWWNQFNTLAWPDTLAMSLRHYISGPGEAREVRRTVLRWALVSNILALRVVSPVVEKRFPSYQSMVDIGILTEKEMNKIEKLDKTLEGKHQIVWYPILWAQALLRKIRKSGLLSSDLHFWCLIKECKNISKLNSILILFVRINIPLVYTQVVTIAVYSYFLASLFGAQYLLPTAYMAAGNKYVAVERDAAVSDTVNLVGYDTTLVDTYIPIFNILEFVFYVGWLQVAVALINPFGEDDEDFDVNYLIDRNIQIGLFMVEDEQVKLEVCPPCSLEYSLGAEARRPPEQESCLSKLCFCCCDSKSSSTSKKELLPSSSTYQSPQTDTKSSTAVHRNPKVQTSFSQCSMSSVSSKCSNPSLSSEKQPPHMCTCNCPVHQKPSDSRSTHKQYVKTQKVSPVHKHDESLQQSKASTKYQDHVAPDIQPVEAPNVSVHKGHLAPVIKHVQPQKVSPEDIPQKTSTVPKSDQQLQPTKSKARASKTRHIETHKIAPVLKRDEHLFPSKDTTVNQEDLAPVVQQTETQKVSAVDAHDDQLPPTNQTPLTQIIQHIGTQNVFPPLKQDHGQLQEATACPQHQENLTQFITHIQTQNVFPAELKRPSSFRTISPTPRQQPITSLPSPSSSIPSPTTDFSIILSPTTTTSNIASPTTTHATVPSRTFSSIIPSTITPSTILPSPTTSSIITSTTASSIIASPTIASYILPSTTTSSTILSSTSFSTFISCTNTSSSTASYSSSSTTTSSPPFKQQLPRQLQATVMRRDSSGPYSAPLPHRKLNY